jgi:hypothetical protein
MVLMGLLGMRFEVNGARFQPLLPPGLEFICLEGLPYRSIRLTVTVEGKGEHMAVSINGQPIPHAFISDAATGEQHIRIVFTPR